MMKTYSLTILILVGAINAQSQMSYHSEIPSQQFSNSDLIKIIENIQQPVAAPSNSRLSISIFFKLNEISAKLDKLIAMQMSTSHQQTHVMDTEPLAHSNHADRKRHTRNKQADGNKNAGLFAVKTTSARNLVKEENILNMPIQKTKSSKDSNEETTTEAAAKSNQLMESHLGGDRNNML